MHIYVVKDSFGARVRQFTKYIDAANYKFTYGNSGWTIQDVWLR